MGDHDSHDPISAVMKAKHDGFCPCASGSDRRQCRCKALRAARADERSGMYARYMVDREAWEAEVRERLRAQVEALWGRSSEWDDAIEAVLALLDEEERP